MAKMMRTVVISLLVAVGVVVIILMAIAIWLSTLPENYF